MAIDKQTKRKTDPLNKFTSLSPRVYTHTVYRHIYRHTDRTKQTDRQTDRHTDRQTDILLISLPLYHQELLWARQTDTQTVRQTERQTA